ncbi:MAG: glycosyltransferase family 4 protein [Planctomycetota bacterium]
MRVAHIITRMIIGGAQENTLFNCQDLVDHYGDEVLLITGPALGPEGDLLTRSGLEYGQSRAGELAIKLLPNLRRNIHPIRDWRAAGELRTALKSFQPDVVHTHSAKGGLLGRRVAWSLGVPAVLHSVHGAPFHAFQSPLAREFFRRCESWAAKRCHHMICVADAMTDLMADAGVADRDKFTTIYSGMDVEPFLRSDTHRAELRKRYGFGEEDVVIGKIARLFHLKGHEDLIVAAKQVTKRFPHARFLLVGDGILRERLASQIESLGMKEHFVFAGLVAPTEVPRLIGAMDALVHTSYREGLARALPQALIAGKPAVSYDVDGAREVVHSGETGFLIPARDTDGLAEALGKLVESGELRRRLGAEGRTRYTDQFRHETMTRRIRDLYLQVLERHRSVSR